MKLVEFWHPALESWLQTHKCTVLPASIRPLFSHNELLVLGLSLLSWCSVHLFSLPLPWCLLLDRVGSSFPNGRWSKSSIPTHPLSPEHSLPRTPLREREREKDRERHTETHTETERKENRDTVGGNRGRREKDVDFWCFAKWYISLDKTSTEDTMSQLTLLRQKNFRFLF